MPDSAQMMQIIMPICGLADPSQWPNSCNLNLYEAVFEGRPGWAWHEASKNLVLLGLGSQSLDFHDHRTH